MDKRIVETSQAPAPIGAYNQAVWGNNTLYISGQIAINPQNNELVQEDLRTETQQVMDNIAAILNEAGLDFSHLVKCSIFLKHIEDFKTVNEIYATHFDEETAPAREAVEVEQLPKGARVEISGIAIA